jgi:homoserine O-acetyltransferase
MPIAPALLLSWLAAAPALTVREGDFVVKDFRFASGERLPELRLHYRTLGAPRADGQGRTVNAVLILHGTGGSGAQFLADQFAGELFGPGQPLDAAQHFIVLPDGIGHGRSSKPSDGLHARFPHYGYDDMVRAQHLLLTQGLGVNHLRLVLGTSMGGMHTWLWGEAQPDFMDALMPLASVPVAIAGRNRMLRHMVMEAIRGDPAWRGGEYRTQPPGLTSALETLFIMGSSPLQLQKQAPDRDAADRFLDGWLAARLKQTDANDMLYQFDSSRAYDPQPRLETIKAPLLAVNSADDEINPPELGILEREIRRVPRGRAVVLPVSDATRGHGTHTWAANWKEHLVALLRESEAGPPAPPRRPPPLLSPEVSADRRVTFRLRAPGAKEVTVAGQVTRDRVALVRDADGVWSATVGPVDPGIYEYGFTIDGLRTLDPANPHIKPQRMPTASILEVPGSPPLLTEFQDVPHGAVHVHQYRSRPLDGRLRRLHVYTPPGYERRPGARYPVLYLLHGSGDNDACWTVHGRAHLILDNLIAQGKATPMIIVMPDGHALPPEEGRSQDNTRAFERDLLEEVIPLVEARYRVKSDARDRAIVGLSMGGNQALAVGLVHADRFAWVGGFSSAVPPREVLEPPLADARALARKLRWLWIGVGKDDQLRARNEELDAWLKERGVRHTWRLTDGGHAWPVWRGYLAEVAPQLFVHIDIDTAQRTAAASGVGTGAPSAASSKR